MSKIVTTKSIEKALNKIDSLTEEALEKKIETFSLLQPDLLPYLMQAGYDFNNDDLNAFTIYYFAVTLEAFNQENIKLKQVAEEEIGEFQDSFLLALDEVSKEDFLPMHELLNQPHLISFILNELEAKDEDGESFDDETQNQLFIVLMGMIGLLNQAIVD